MQEKKIKVTFFQRKPRSSGNHSVEGYYNSVRNALSEKIISTVAVSEFVSSGIFKRLYNCAEAFFRQGDINHITGDIHYVNVFLKRKKNILTILDCGQLKRLKGIRFKIFLFFWFTLPAKKSQYITTISTATKEDLLQYIRFNAERIKVVPVCISAAFKRVDKAFNKLKPRILQVGTAPNKNIERLISALEGIPCELVIIGPVSNHLNKLAEEKGVELISFPNKITEDEVVIHYGKADIIALISTLEGFGMPIVEGNAVGRVVITGNITSMPEVGGQAAHFVDPYSEESIRDGFKKIIGDETYRNNLINKGYENCKRFSTETIALQYEEIYRDIFNNSKK